MTTPNTDCPVIGLREAVRRFEMIHNEVQDHPVSKSVIADALQYNSQHGTFYLMISALIQYRLMETVGDQLKVRAEAKKLLHSSRVNREKYLEALEIAAFAPPLFKELHQLYNNRVPGNNELKEFFRRKEIKQSKIDGAVRAYRDTIQFINEQAKTTDELGSSGMSASPRALEQINPEMNIRSSMTLPTLNDEKKENVFRFHDPYGEIYIKINDPVTAERFQYLIEFALFQQKLLEDK